ncbi:MAG: transposase [Gammaproteobacteria bacterium]|nr:transposase [Gammaproteobacteria bacterium]
MAGVTRSYRLRAYPNSAQRRMSDRWLGAVRWLWNTSLAIRSAAYSECKLSLTSVDISRWLTQWKQTPGHTWLADIPATCLTQCLRDQDRAFGNFFAHRARYPKLKPKRAGGSLRFQDVGAGWSDGALRLPKLGILKLAEDLPQIEKPDLVTLSKDASGHYFVSFSAEIDTASFSLPIVNRSVGVDLGLRHLATLSTGEKVPNPKRLKAHTRYLRQQQRCLERRKKGSKRREKQRLRVARIHARIRDERRTAIHQLTTRLVREFDLISIEHLNVKALARGMHARAIQDAAFGEIRRQLLYKGNAAGRVILEVSQWFPSSKTCSHCRHVIDRLKLDERQWRCPKCGTRHDRDINAARSILHEGMREIAGCDDRVLRVDARSACFDDYEFIEQVLAEEARSGHHKRAGSEPARLG